MSPKERPADLPAASTARQFDMELPLAASRDEVWRALTDGPALQRWFAPQAEVTPGVGGSITWRWEDSWAWTQTIEVWEPGARLRTRYDSPVDDGAGAKVPLFLDFTLTGTGGATTLRLVHSGFGPGAEFDQEYDGISHGWPVELRSLRLYLEQHLGTERQLARVIHPVSGSYDAAWQRLTGEGGFVAEQDLLSLGEGDAFRIRTAAGHLFEGEALVAHAHEFIGVVRNWGDAFLRIGVENCGGNMQVWLWLAAYGRPQAEVDAVRASWETLVAELFPGEVLAENA